MARRVVDGATGTQLSFEAQVLEPKCSVPTPMVLTRSTVMTTPVFDTYWRFAAERQQIFFRRTRGEQGPWTDDPILQKFRFTNAYRVADRVSQYLISHVQEAGPQDGPNLLLRTILFKLFNRIDTWQLLERAVGTITTDSYNGRVFDEILSDALQRGQRIYSAAYIMPSGGGEGSRKHQMHLRLLESMLHDDLAGRLADSRSMAEAFERLRSYPTIGDFLAYQYVTDLNYTRLLDFSEMDFVVPGPGAKSGIRKCFADLGSYSEADIIRWMTEHQEEEFRKRGIEFLTLWGRPLHLIDCQNLFCEVDKYARVHHPEIAGLSGRVRIKQEYKTNPDPIDFFLPAKWHLNDRIHAWRDSACHPRLSEASRLARSWG